MESLSIEPDGKYIESQIAKIIIVILNWNGKEDTIECIKSIQQIKYDNYETVVVDNGSTDNSVQEIRSVFGDQVSIIETGANLGYAEGNNRGIEYALQVGADYIFILNNDTIVDTEILNNFLQASKDYPEAGVFGAKIYYRHEPNKIWYAGAKWNSETAYFNHIARDCFDDPLQWNAVEETAFICGCTLFIKAEILEKVGLLDKKYFLTWEDIDFSFRVRKNGFKCLFVPNAIVWHKESSSFKEGTSGLLYQYFTQRNRFLWIEQHLQFLEKIKIYRTIIFPEVLVFLKGYLSPRVDIKQKLYYKVRLIAFYHYLIRKTGDCPNWLRN